MAFAVAQTLKRQLHSLKFFNVLPGSIRPCFWAAGATPRRDNLYCISLKRNPQLNTDTFLARGSV